MFGDRNTGGLGGEIPKGEVDAGQGKGGDAVASLENQLALDLLAEFARVVEFTSDEEGNDGAFDDGGDGTVAEVAEAFPPADETGVRFDADEAEVEGVPFGGEDAFAGAAVVKRDGDEYRVDFGDLHRSGIRENFVWQD